MISLARIDDRLIHGQMVTKWLKQCDANYVLVIDDGTAKDAFASQMCIAVAPRGVTVEVLTAVDAAKKLVDSYQNDQKIRACLLFKGPQSIETLLENGVEIKKVILGGMGMKPGRNKFWKTIYVSDEDKESFKRILDKGTEVICQLTPETGATPVQTLL